jgi:hypothetical protein
MKLSKKIKNVSKILFTAYAINNFSMPIGYLIGNIPSSLTNSNIQTSMQTGDYVYNYVGTDEEISLDFLKLAHAITLKNIDYTRENLNDDNDNLNAGIGDCYEIGRFTYSNYLYLIDRVGKSDLSKFVKLSAGQVFTSSGGGGHMWLEIFQEGEWKNYDTTSINFPKSIIFDPRMIDYVISDNDVLDLDWLNYNKTVSWQSMQGERAKIYPSLEGILKSRGFSYMLYSNVKNSI